MSFPLTDFMRARHWLLIAVLFGFSLAHSGRAAVPKAAPGWTVELVAQAPAVSHPSVVATAPDGRVFVAEDPMDIRTPHADAMEGRILCLHPDGRITVFATNLYAVFGMQYLEGKLYVLHNPKFSVFTDDDGVGRARAELIEQTNPKPWALDWNDHVPANFRLGMDGYFYVAVGDKGLYGARGRDGSRVELHGGGILRLRPDGTALEIFCTGNRNILDVAMNAEDEFFTYDNTDEHDWMGRLTHMVERGAYGYPHDFIPRRPYTLWMMHDFGGGAATGAECYTGDALPAEYQGNLFLADFGKRQVLRVQTEREGATYRVVKHQEMFPNPPEDFRPVGIAWAADGRSLFVCDWAHADSKENVKVGRLWKLTYTNAVHATPKPAWFVAAASGKVFTASTEELVSALSHPSRNVRLTAQRQLITRGSRREQALITAVATNPAAPAVARWHALWALSGIGGDDAHAAITATIQDRDASVRRQAIRAAANDRNARPAIVARLADTNADVRFAAATALGRSADTNTIPALLAALNEPDLFARFAVFTALNRIGRAQPDGWAQIAAALNSDDAKIREGAEFALRDTFDEQLVEVLAASARSRGPHRESALRLLSALHHRLPEWKGEWWAYHPALTPPAEKTVAWAGTKTVLDTLSAATRDAEPALRLTGVDGLLAARATNSAPVLREAFARETNTAVRQAMLRALASFRDVDSAPLIASLLREPSTDAETIREAVRSALAMSGAECRAALLALAQSDRAGRVEAIRALGELRGDDAIPALTLALQDPAPAVRLAALDALGQIKSEASSAALLKAGVTGSVEERRALARALGNQQSPKTVPRLLELWRANDTRPDALTALTRRGDARALDAYLDGLASANPTVREQCRKALTGIRDEVLPGLESRAATLSATVAGELRAVYRGTSAVKQSALFTAAARALEPEDYARFALTNRGDAVRGQRIFWDESGVACLKCHAIAGHGGTVGPDMTLIGVQFPRRELIESVLYPSRVVREGYQQVMVETRDGDSFSGIVASETGDKLVLRDAQGQFQTIAKARIESRQTSALSLMPEGLHVGLTLEQFGDLMAFLESRKSDARKVESKVAPTGFASLLAAGEPGRAAMGWRELPAGTKRVDAAQLKLGRPAEHWSLTNGVLEHDGLTGDLWTEREFGDFHLMLEWRWADAPKWENFPLINADGLEAGPDGRAATARVLDAGDSGVLLRGLYKAQANLFCYPVGSGEFWEYRTDPNSTREQRRAFTPKKNADRPIGSWNEMEIQLRGDRVTVTVNGEQVITNAELPGLPARGPVGLQHEHGRIQFRNLFIHETQP